MLFCFGPPLSAQTPEDASNESENWSIVSVTAVPGSEDKSPDAGYFVHFSLSGSDGMSGEGDLFSNADMSYILRIFGIQEPDGLVGKVVGDSHSLGPALALRRILHRQKYPNYVPPRPWEFDDMLRYALARLSCPDFQAHDPLAIKRAFEKLYQWSAPHADLVRDIAKKAAFDSDDWMVGEVFKLPEQSSPELLFGVSTMNKRVEIRILPGERGLSAACVSKDYDWATLTWVVSAISSE
jgi:hypothetical protein